MNIDARERSNCEWHFLFRITQIFHAMVLAEPVAAAGLVWMLGVICKDSVEPEEEYSARRLYESPETVIRHHFPLCRQGLETAEFGFSTEHLADISLEKSEEYNNLVLAAFDRLAADLETYLKEDKT